MRGAQHIGNCLEQLARTYICIPQVQVTGPVLEWCVHGSMLIAPWHVHIGDMLNPGRGRHIHSIFQIERLIIHMHI